ncbi:MAG: mannose-6-phosphate isomerase, class I [Desulfococcus sp. 4484_241]|nr:MAG: mannose-6-phosphate isomerase, class I [Desulfococcus sp. 4484_241]
MGNIKLLDNTIQHYAWGSRTAIPALLGLATPSTEPCAELWMGAHPKAPSMIKEDGAFVSLAKAIEKQPLKMLGESTAARFNNTLPFLFKVLASEKPLSIQAHPDKETAARGFERENRAGIPLDSPARNYKDPNHKPECLCALTRFHALCGFRAADDLARLFDVLLPHDGEKLCRDLDSPDGSGLSSFFTNLIQLSEDRRTVLIKTAVKNARLHSGEDPAFEWILRLHEEYPADIGILAPAFLNLLVLQPGDAVFLSAGILHSYLGGTGIEIMANSDNVLRGGLTQKHVDPEELSRVVVFRETEPHIVKPVSRNGCETVYPLPVEEFGLSVLRVSSGIECRTERTGVPQILLCIEGEATVHEHGGDDTLLKKGNSAFVPACSGHLRVTGDAVIYCAFVPA